MKMNKFFMLGLAGLAFAACSNEEEISNNGITDLSAVTIKISAPEMTRSVSPATPGDAATVEVTPAQGTTVTITLESSGDSQKIELTPEQWEAGQTVTFWNVNGPSKVSVSMNNGIASYAGIDIATGTPNLQVLPESIPVYGETQTITATTTSVTPRDYTTTGDDHQTGAAADGSDDNKTYQLYTATVNLEIPVARLEVSGIKHAHTLSNADCQYATLTIDGVYLDNVKATDEGQRKDYQFVKDGSGTGDEAILKDEIQNSPSFLDGSSWPQAIESVPQAYAFNFYGPSEAEINAAGDDEAKQALNPKFKIYFENATAATGQDPVLAPRYAMITNYKDTEGNSIILENGHIYRIVEATLTDDNIIGDEGGNTLAAVEVTVVEASWTVQTIEADWAD